MIALISAALSAAVGGAFAATLGLGFLYFIAAIPAGTAAGLSVWVATLAAWIGYCAGAGVILLAGSPLRNFLARKIKLPTRKDANQLLWRIWDRFGLPGLGFLAPITIGPQASALLALATGEKPLRIFVAISIGVLPWCLGIAALTLAGVRVTQSSNLFLK